MSSVLGVNATCEHKFKSNPLDPPLHYALLYVIALSYDFVNPGDQLGGTLSRVICVQNAYGGKGRAADFMSKSHLLHFALLTCLLVSRGDGAFKYKTSKLSFRGRMPPAPLQGLCPPPPLHQP